MQAENWLLGALITEVAAVCDTLAAIFLRRATYGNRGAFPVRGGEGPAANLLAMAFGGASIEELLCHGAFWGSLCLRIASNYLWWQARCNAPDTTVAPLFMLVSFIVNMAAGPALLHEQYRSREVVVALGCVAAVAMTTFLDRYIMDPWPSLSTCIVDLHYIDFRKGEGGAILCCTSLWLLVVILCLIQLWKDRHRLRIHAAPVPILAGLMSGANYFVGYVGFPFCVGFEQHELKVEVSGQAQILWLVALLLLNFFSTWLAIKGAYLFDCRYFVPASSTVAFFTATVMRVLLSKHWHQTGSAVVVPFLVAHAVLLVWPFFISSERSLIKLPRMLKKEEESPQPGPWMPEFSNPLKHGTVDPLPLVATPLLEFGEEPAGGDLPDPDHETPLLCIKPPKHPGLRWLFRKWVAVAMALPLAALLSAPLALLLVVLYCENAMHRILVIATYTAWAAGATGVRIAVFSSVGRLRIRLGTATDYPELCKVGRKTGNTKKPRKSAGGGKLMLISDPFDTPGSSSSEDDDTPMQTVHHIVVVEGACDPRRGFQNEELHGLLHSIERSPLAATQIAVLILAGESHMQAVDALQREFAHTIRWSPPWHALRPKSPSGQLYDFAKQSFVERNSFRSRMVLVTYTTADAVFHPGYFSALTFAFLSSGDMRSTTIWQPPVLHVKDYTAQSIAVRHASLFMSQHQLASLTDPMAVPLPASTCSLPLSLLRAIDGCWEPNCPPPQMNSGIWTKCWLTTIGRSSVKPIFLPVLRSAVRTDDLNPWGQVLRITQGLVELVHFWSALPLALFNGRIKPSSVGRNRLLCLFLRSVPPLLGITWSHIALSTWFLAMCSNWLVLLIGWRCWPESLLNSGPFLLAATAALLSVGILPTLFVAHVALIEQLPLQTLLPPNAEGDGPGASPLFRRPVLHLLELLLTGVLANPVLFCMLFFGEWCRGLVLGCYRGSPAPEAFDQDQHIQHNVPVRKAARIGDVYIQRMRASDRPPRFPAPRQFGHRGA